MFTTRLLEQAARFVFIVDSAVAGGELQFGGFVPGMGCQKLPISRNGCRESLRGGERTRQGKTLRCLRRDPKTETKSRKPKSPPVGPPSSHPNPQNHFP